MYIEDLVAGTEVSNRVVDILGHFRKRSLTELDTIRVAWVDFDQPSIGRMAAHDSRKADKLGDRRIIRMNGEAYSFFFGHWRHSFDPVLQVAPQVLFRVFGFSCRRQRFASHEPPAQCISHLLATVKVFY